MVRPTAILIGLACGCAVLSTGCRRDSPDARETGVRGSVHFQGEPLAGGRIAFAPDPDRGGSGKPLSAEIAADGCYRLPAGAADGLPPGWYRVAIAAGPARDPDFPRQLARPDQSGLIREIKPGRDNVFDFAIEAPAGR